jgi:hypothetical protein
MAQQLYIVCTNGSTTALPLPIRSPVQSSVRAALHRLCNGSTIAQQSSVWTALQTALQSSVRMALQQLYDGYTTAIWRLYDGSTIVRKSPIRSSVQTALHRLYVVSTNGPTASSLRRPYIVSTTALRSPIQSSMQTALQRLYDIHSIVRTNVSTIIRTNGCSPALRTALQQLNKQLYKRL